MARDLKRRAGFTLIEMLVVMIIMVILFGISAPLLLKMESAGVVENSARQLQGVLMQARSLAAKHSTNYSVVFSYWGYTPSVTWSSGKISISNKWTNSVANNYAICGHKPNGSFPSTIAPVVSKWEFSTPYTAGAKIRSPSGTLYVATNDGTSAYSQIPTFSGSVVDESLLGDTTHTTLGTVIWATTADAADWTANYQVGPDYYLEEGAKFIRLSHKDAADNAWDKSYSMGDSKYLVKHAAFRVTFTPTGEAHFISFNESGGDDDHGWQTIIVGSGTVDLVKHYGNYISVRVNKYSGDIKIEKPKPTP